MRSLSFRLALLVGALGLFQAIAVLVFSHHTMSRSLDEQKRHLLNDKLIQARALTDRQPALAALPGIAYQMADMLSGHENLHIAVGKAQTQKGSALVAFTPIAVESLHRLETATWGSDAFLEWRMPQTDKPMLSVATASETQNGEEYVIVLTAERTEDEVLLSTFWLTALTAAPFALAIVSLGALLIVKVGLRPINRFRDAAIAISANNLSGRIDPASLPTELLPLCQAFNDMLERLDEGICRLSQFSSDLAHEMRTPLGILLGRTQVTLSQPRTHAQLLEVLESNVQELEQLTRLVSDMLFLARADDTSAVLHATPIRLEQVAQQVADFMEVLAEEKQVRFDVTGTGEIFGDTGLVQRALTNLLSNAVRHGSSNSVVTIQVQAATDFVDLIVHNHGQPIPPEHQSRLFDRFYRLDASRTRDGGGTGLGLAIVKAIMKLHNGNVEVASHADGRTSFTLHFPKHAAVPATMSPQR